MPSASRAKSIAEQRAKRAARRKMMYSINCVNSTMEKINALQESGKRIGRETFVGYVDRASLKAVEKRLQYDTGAERGGLRMKDDWHVAYYRGVYDGQPCVYFVHSAIEWIFL